MPDVSYPGVYVEELAGGVHPIAGVATSTAAFVGARSAGPVDQATHVRSFGDFQRIFGTPPVEGALDAAVRLFFLNGGAHAIVVRASDRPVPVSDDGTGVHAIGAPDRFNLLCLPDLGVAQPLAAGEIATQLAAASQLCQERRAILIVDPLPGWQTVADVVSPEGGVEAIASGMRRANAAVYFPRIVARAPAGGTQEFPPSGAVAGIMARSDLSRGLWKAPAGEEAVIHGIEDLALHVSDDEARVLSDRGVNPLRTLAGVGPLVWGARTPEGAAGRAPSEWRYIPVRRMALYIEESLDHGLDWVVFEPNFEPLWAAIRASVGNFMEGLFQAGAFQGASPREAFFVKCNRETTTQRDVETGLVRLLVGFAMLRPAEFTVLEIQHAAGQPP